MWTMYAGLTPDPNRRTNIGIADFKPNEYVTEADFNNLSNTNIYVNFEYNSFDKFAQQSTTNLIGNNRWNIFHNKIVNGVVEFEYDGCGIEWLYTSLGSGIYQITGYRHGDLTYTCVPVYNNAQIPKEQVIKCQLVATKGNGKGGIGVVRPLWYAVINTQYNTKMYWLGAAIPNATIDAWLPSDAKDDDDDPIKPDPDFDPSNADGTDATNPTHTWLNQFKVMNWTGKWPARMLIEPPSSGQSYASEAAYYFAYAQGDDYNTDYYTSYINYGGNTAWKDIITNLNNDIAEAGSSLYVFRSTGSSAPEGYFSKGFDFLDSADGIDTSTYVEYNFPGSDGTWSPVIADNMHLTLTGKTLRSISLDIGGKSFNIADNYANYPWTSGIDSWGGSMTGRIAPYIIRYNGEYYLGGYTVRIDAAGALYDRYTSGFVVICRISDLKNAPGYGGSDPDDPTPTGDPDDDGGLPKDGIDDSFGDGTGTKDNPSTDKETNDNTGDNPTEDPDNPDAVGSTGSAYGPDGRPINPANTGNDPIGTHPPPGEKNSNPVDSHQVPNTHDGSMGNGTGNPHTGDTEISNPSTTMPTTAGTPGTVSGSGVLDVFTPTQAELNAFTSELLSSTVLDSIKNFFTTNPMDGIFALHILPYTGFEGTATAAPRIGTHTFTSTLTMAQNEFITVDYGTVYVPFVYDGYENYAPNSDVKIFLPFIGTKDIDINVIQGCKCSLKYNVSLVTGDIYAYLYCQWASKWGDAGTERGIDHLVYSWQGNCAATVPLSHLDSTNYISGAMQAAGGITSLVAGAAGSNPFAIPAGIAGVTQGVAEMGRTSIITSGNISGMAAFMGCREPFFIFSRPIIAFNSAYNHYLGQRSNAIERIGNLRNGTFTVMRNIDLTGLSATTEELSEIESLLKGGFYI